MQRVEEQMIQLTHRLKQQEDLTGIARADRE